MRPASRRHIGNKITRSRQGIVLITRPLMHIPVADPMAPHHLWGPDFTQAAGLTGNVLVTILNRDTKAHIIELHDNSYKTGGQTRTIGALGKASFLLDLSKSQYWYDFSIRVKGYASYEERFAGHVETGRVTTTDPLMGGII